MNWLIENWETILQILGSFYAVASLIATLTPSDKDNTALEKIGKIADRFGLKLKGK